MKTTILTNGKEVTICLAERLDTASSSETSAFINRELEKVGGVDAVVCDASRLEYISSSGLRILLSLSKRYRDFRLTGVQPQVYEVLNTTGFTKIMTVERAMRRMIVEGCQLIGMGGVGKVYRLDGDTIIKVFREGTTLEEVRQEIVMSKEAFVLGMPTAISFDIVTVAPTAEGRGECYGLIYELLQAETLSAMVRKHPEKMDEYARKYARLFKEMHQIEVPAGGNVPSAIRHERAQVERLVRYFPQEKVDMLLNILDSIPPGNRLLHLDLQTKNAMVQNDELMLIDMGEVGYGHPLLDLGHAYSAMVTLVGDYDAIIGMPRESGRQMWQLAIDDYFEGLPADVVAERKAMIDVVSRVRSFSWLSLSDSFPEALVKECQSLFDERVTKCYDYLMNVCKTFEHWTL
ncbi:MAG: phosphotransferase [Bacteroidaceae bacterium]|nr:phosphotransferase [Bacteroidaceae bacterium]